MGALGAEMMEAGEERFHPPLLQGGVEGARPGTGLSLLGPVLGPGCSAMRLRPADYPHHHHGNSSSCSSGLSPKSKNLAWFLSLR